MSERRMTLDGRLHQLRETLDREIDEAATDNVWEITEAVGRVYDEHPRELDASEEDYSFNAGARIALWTLLKELDIDPESVREGWE